MINKKIKNFSSTWVKETSIKYKITGEDDRMHESLYTLIFLGIFLYVFITYLLFYYLNVGPLDAKYFKTKNALEYVIVGIIFCLNILYVCINYRHVTKISLLLDTCNTEEKFILMVLASYYKSLLQINILMVLILAFIYLRIIVFHLFIGFELGDYNCLLCEVLRFRTRN